MQVNLLNTYNFWPLCQFIEHIHMLASISVNLLNIYTFRLLYQLLYLTHIQNDSYIS